MIEKELGKELDFEIKRDGAEAIIVLEHVGKLGSVKLEAKTDLATLVDKITDLIPGDWDDTMIDPLVAKLAAKKDA